MRRALLGAVCGLAWGCALAAPAGARQDSGSPSNSTSTAGAATKTSSTSTHKSNPISSSSSAVKKTSGKTSGKRSRRKSRVRGQQKIDSERARAIQEALIREHYLSGEPTGSWNQSSEDAMRKYQADHGWQSKTVPDSRALISLGLGPSKDHLLNPESAMTTVPDPPKSQAAPTSHPSPATEPIAPASSPPPAASTPPTGETPSPQ